MEQKEPLYYQFRFIWGILTVIYLILYGIYWLGALIGVFPYFMYFIGLFVPFGFWNTLASIHSGKIIITATLLIFSLSYADKFARKFLITNPFKRILLNLLWLLLLTALIDFILWGTWPEGHVAVPFTKHAEMTCLKCRRVSLLICGARLAPVALHRIAA
jgi:hypothetical protein